MISDILSFITVGCILIGTFLNINVSPRLFEVKKK